jgi:phosphoserine phosphatase
MKLYVPLMQTVLNAENNEKYVKWLKEMDCDTVFISGNLPFIARRGFVRRMRI